MWISKLNINNIRSFIRADVPFSEGINIIIGPNNAGKSTILKSLLLLQYSDAIRSSDLRHLCTEGTIEIAFGGNAKQHYSNARNATGFKLDLPGNNRTLIAPGASRGAGESPRVEPENFIYPHLSKRKVTKFTEQINLGNVQSVTGNFLNLYPKIDRIADPEFLPAYKEYTQACDEILGFRVTSTASKDGKKAAYIIENLDHIAIDAMGDGISNILGLIVDLCLAKNKLFLIEEPENDIHPKALKKLMGLIAEKSEKNQFVITTHSNIVTKYLGAQSDSKIFSVSMKFQDKIPTSTIETIDTPEKRRTILEELGYELYDYDLWDNWLFLEESSAERIIRDFLIPFFAPDLQSKLRTFSAHSVSEIESKFKDFNNLFVFLHLQPSYKNKAWVILDAGDQERTIVEQMKSTYSQSGWDESHFLQFSEHDFERYYPSEFQEQVTKILDLTDKPERRRRKKELLEQLIAWCNEDKDRTKEAFEASASEVIRILRDISAAISDR